jgi:hypothetical protein
MPTADLVLRIQISFQPHVVKCAIANKFLASAEAGRQILDPQFWNKIVFVGVKARRPDKPAGDSFRARLRSDLQFPFHSVFVVRRDFRGCAMEILTVKAEDSARLVLLAPAAIEQVA